MNSFKERRLIATILKHRNQTADVEMSESLIISVAVLKQPTTQSVTESFNDELHRVRLRTVGIDHVNLMHSHLLFCLSGRQGSHIEDR